MILPKRDRPTPRAIGVTAIALVMVAALGWGAATASWGIVAFWADDDAGASHDPATPPAHDPSGGSASQPTAGWPNTRARDHTIFMNASDAGPLNITIASGDSVTWQNNDRAAHELTGDEGSGIGRVRIEPRSSWSYTFVDMGTYHFHCIHEGVDAMFADMAQMEGVVIVERAG